MTKQKRTDPEAPMNRQNCQNDTQPTTKIAKNPTLNTFDKENRIAA